MLVYDSHCHLEYIRKLAIHNIPALIPGVNLADNQPLARLRAVHPKYKIGFGIHPWYVTPDTNVNSLLLHLRANVEKYQPDCIGEIGLDYIKPSPDIQNELFIRQLQLAAEFNLPVILHCVHAYNEVLKAIKDLNIKRGIIHGFNANSSIAEAFMRQGFFLGIGSLITRTSKIKSCLPSLPPEYLVMESDAPYMPAWHKTASTSSDTFLYAQIAARELNVNLIDFINTSNANFLRLFAV